MLKGDAVTNTITITGIIVVGVLMFTRVPGMVDDIKLFLSKESVVAKAAEIADLLTLTTISPDSIKITYRLSEEVSFKVSVKDGIVNVSKDTDWAISKTLSELCFKFDPCDVGYTYFEFGKTCVCVTWGEPDEDCPHGYSYEHEKCKPEAVKVIVITKDKIEKVE